MKWREEIISIERCTHRPILIDSIQDRSANDDD